MKTAHKQAGRSGLKEKSERGFMLLEVLVSILLFALGITALAGLQARSLETTDDMQYRAEAIHLTNAHIGKIWAAAGVVSGGTVTDAQLKGQFAGAGGSGGDGYADFSSQVTKRIPGATSPTVEIAPQTATYTDRATGKTVDVPGVEVTITVNWVDRQDDKFLHAYKQTSFVAYNP